MKKNLSTTPHFGHPFNLLKENYVAFCILLFAFCFLPYVVQAQCLPPTGTAEIGVNNIRALFKTNGTHFFREGGNAEFEVPKGSGKTSFFAASLWLAGLDEQNKLHVAAMRHGQGGNDFWTGPFSNDMLVSSAYYNKFWRLTKFEVEFHKTNYMEEGYWMHDAIANWPANGRAEFEETHRLAPYKNVSGNSSYTPEEGDYPLIRGDEAIFWINNDICSNPTESGGQPLGVEVLNMAYAYNSADEDLNNTLFLSYVIKNQSQNSYKDFYIGFFADFDIGYGDDDYIGCDPALNLAYGYNGLPVDEGGLYAYGENPPAQGVMFLNQNMSAFMYMNNDISLTGVPQTAQDYYNYTQAKWKDGTPLTMWGSGYDPESTEYTAFAYSGNPAAKTGWTEFTPNGEGSTPNVPNDCRGVLSAGPFDLPAGKSICIDIALPFAQGENHLASVTLLKQRAQAIQQFYNSQNYESFCAGGMGIRENEQNLSTVQIYPNPSNGRFVITCDKIMENIELYDVMGKKVMSVTPKVTSTEINANLPQGLYMYRIVLQDNSIVSGKITVQ